MFVNLTFAGVGGGLRSLRVSVEAGFTFLTLASFCVVETVAHASAALARLAPRRPIKMAALSVSVTLALWSEREEMNTSATKMSRVEELYSSYWHDFN